MAGLKSGPISEAQTRQAKLGPALSQKHKRDRRSWVRPSLKGKNEMGEVASGSTSETKAGWGEVQFGPIAESGF